ncbi:PH domain-containing protein [Thermophilibacter provencensis]|uniref:PH domain-containing protein n=1 Tax=Thermophilibacter provencensis TaxID=1852386 RepID=A0ABT7V2Q5_9ACTN|nr:PH domain-containing protein [Thermophilibacter provencensis]MDM8270888.1 PH domain-containing protein [Thermophilibacter provencensis]
MSAGEKDGRPPAPGAPSDEPISLEKDLERLTVPERSLFEEAGATPEALLGTRRANPLSVVVEALKMTSGLVAIVAFGLAGDFFAGDLGTITKLVLAAAAIFAACLLLSFAVWRARTWELTAEGVRLCWGLGWGPFSRRSLTIPYEHIHTVSMNSSLLDRVFGLLTLDLDTGAAASEGDASKISGLRAGEADVLRAELFRRKRAASGQTGVGEKDVPLDDAPAEGRPLATFSLAGRELALAAASQMSAGSQALALVVLLVNGANQLIEWGLLDVVGRGDELMAGISPVVVPAVLAFLAVALLLGAAVSFVVNLVRYAGYRVERFEDRVVVEHGLLSRSSRALAAGRVQYVAVRQGIIRQLIGYAEVTAQVVATPGEKDGEPSGSVLLHPFIRVGEVDAFLAEVLPDCAGVLGSVELGRLGPVARRRAVVRAVIWWPFATAIFFGVHWLFGFSGLLESAAWLLEPLLVAAAVLSVVLLVGFVADALRAWGAARYGQTARELVLVTGGLTRLTVIAPRARLQRMEVRANPFQRRAGVATLSVRTAASDADGLDLRDLPADAADELLSWYRPRA